MNDAVMDDAALVERAAAQDVDAFADLYRRHAGRLYDFLWWVLQDRQEASQALYDTFLDAGSRIHELRDPAKVRPWLLAIASRQALRRHRRPAAPEAPDEAQPPAPAPAGRGGPQWDELVGVVRSLASDLAPKERALLDLRYRQGLEGQELAEALGVRVDYATELLDRLSAQVEETLSDTVVAYLGRSDCPELRVLLGDGTGDGAGHGVRATQAGHGVRATQAGHLDARQRGIVAMHAEHCAICGERRRRRIGAGALFGVSPALPAPPSIGPHVMEDVQLAAHRGRRWGSRRDGFPRPILVDTDRRRRTIAVAGMVVLIGAGTFLVTRGGRVPEEVASVGRTATTSPTTLGSPTTLTTVPLTTTTSALPDPAAGGPTGSPATGSGSGAGGTSGGTSGGTGTGAGSGAGSGSGSGSDTGGSDTGGSGSGSGDTTSTTEAPSTPATTAATAPPTTADTQGPSLSGLSVSPSVIRAGGRCTNNNPTQATVSVQASDPSGITSIRVTVAGPQTGGTDMASAGGSTYTATIGPFESPLPPGTDFPGQVIVQARDGAGNTAATTAPITIRCTP